MTSLSILCRIWKKKSKKNFLKNFAFFFLHFMKLNFFLIDFQNVSDLPNTDDTSGSIHDCQRIMPSFGWALPIKFNSQGFGAWKVNNSLISSPFWQQMALKAFNAQRQHFLLVLVKWNKDRYYLFYQISWKLPPFL